jgi:hypothetical protein
MNVRLLLTLRRLLLTLFISTACGQTPNPAFIPERALIGQWKGTDSDGVTASMTFNADGTFKMVSKNRVFDGPTMGGKISWQVDAGHQPMNLDIVATPPLDKETVLPMTVRFINPTKIEIGVRGDRRSWPIAFSLKKPNEKVVLTKQ